MALHGVDDGLDGPAVGGVGDAEFVERFVDGDGGGGGGPGAYSVDVVRGKPSGADEDCTKGVAEEAGELF
ncbi:hypothetical protein ABT154_26965 [Streptomyces sp. NPDC001728]|uniref:hypothetical protein n=1 Tax=Streptomyces sp. NPDC001728 TaxID=3154396 RepID=UPI0033329B83